MIFHYLFEVETLSILHVVFPCVWKLNRFYLEKKLNLFCKFLQPTHLCRLDWNRYSFALFENLILFMVPSKNLNFNVILDLLDFQCFQIILTWVEFIPKLLEILIHKWTSYFSNFGTDFSFYPLQFIAFQGFYEFI